MTKEKRLQYFQEHVLPILDSWDRDLYIRRLHARLETAELIERLNRKYRLTVEGKELVPGIPIDFLDDKEGV